MQRLGLEFQLVVLLLCGEMLGLSAFLALLHSIFRSSHCLFPFLQVIKSLLEILGSLVGKLLFACNVLLSLGELLVLPLRARFAVFDQLFSLC